MENGRKCIKCLKKENKKVVPSGVEPLSLGPGPKGLPLPHGTMQLFLVIIIYKLNLKKSSVER